jgi:NitT/TauT family transport system substrate-binding protein
MSMTGKHGPAAAALSLLAALVFMFGVPHAAQAMDMSAGGPPVHVGVVRSATAGWELDVIKHHQFDEANGFSLEVVDLINQRAAETALRRGKVDVIVADFVWTSQQRAKGTPLTFVPHSRGDATLMVRPDSGIGSLADLEGKKLGVAGGSSDTNWLLLKAYAQKKFGVDLAAAAPKFIGAPLLNELMIKGDLPAVLSSWDFDARLEAAGMQRLVGVADILPELGVDHPPALVGWVFNEEWAKQSPELINGFLNASLAAAKVMATSDEEWDRLRDMTMVKDDATFVALRDAYRADLVTSSAEQSAEAADQTFRILSAAGGAEGKGLAAGTYWAGFSF